VTKVQGNKKRNEKFRSLIQSYLRWNFGRFFPFQEEEGEERGLS
jgi:hypothetical protein